MDPHSLCHPSILPDHTRSTAPTSRTALAIALTEFHSIPYGRKFGTSLELSLCMVAVRPCCIQSVCQLSLE